MKWIKLCSLFFGLAVLSEAALPAGRLAFVNDASASRDADDVCEIPFQVAILMAFGATGKLAFDQITNHKVANELLKGSPPRKEWEPFFKL